MDRNQVMREAAGRALRAVFGVQPGERLLVITDQGKRPIGEAFLAAGTDLGLTGESFVLPEADRPLREIPDSLRAALADRDLVVNAFQGIAAETPFRIQLINLIMTIASRLAHCPGIDEAMMTTGPMNVDYHRMQRQAEELMAALAGARSVRLRAPGGTDLELFIEERGFKTDVVVPPGAWGNLPAGEIWCGPEETRGSGILVCDGSVGDLGPVPAPLTLEIEAGRITRIACPDTGFAARVKELTDIDPEACVVGELGIGLNPGARVTGNMLEDEKAFETIHVAFGHNEDMPGGRNRSRTHRDFLVRRPTLVVTYAAGRTRGLIEEGKIRL